jgi:uncharacterized OB-fold protein
MTHAPDPAAPAPSRRPIRADLFTQPLDALEQVRLQGSQCQQCAEVALGVSGSCQNCASQDMKVIPLSREGELWTYTVIRNRPPGDYKGADPFVPFGEGLVELPEGIRIKSPLGGKPGQFSIGMKLRLVCYALYTDAEGKDVIAFRFDPVGEQTA